MESTGNHIAMVSGAQRVLLTPPNQCPKMAIRQYYHDVAPDRHPPVAPSSMLNFGHMPYLMDYYHRNNMTALTIITEDDEAYMDDDTHGDRPPTIRGSKARSKTGRRATPTSAAATKDDDDGMSKEERYWLQKAGHALSVETVLKEGEVLFVPSYWPHYTISLQKSAQCTVPYNTGDNPKPGVGLDSFNRCNRYL